MKNNKPEYVAITVPSLKECFRKIPCDVFMEISESYFVKTFDRKTGIDFQRLAQYTTKGVKELFVRKEDFEVFQKFMS